MANRHTNYCDQIDDSTVDDEIRTAQVKMEREHGKGFASAHELYALLEEELDEFWDSIKAHDPDPKELMDLAVLVRAGLLWLCQQGRDEVQEMKRESDPHIGFGNDYYAALNALHKYGFDMQESEDGKVLIGRRFDAPPELEPEELLEGDRPAES